MMKNRIFAIILSFMLIMPVFATEPQNSMLTAEEKEVIETVYNQTAVDDASNLPENKVAPAPTEQIVPQTYKQPTSKRKIAKKFLMAMLGVGISSFLIFGLLTIYNKIRENFVSGEIVNSSHVEDSLESPEDLLGAIKTFLDKTKWE